MENETYATVFSLCRIDPDLTMSTGNGNGGAGSGSFVLGSYINFAIMLNPGCSVYGCVFEFGVFQGGGAIENDSIVHDTWAMSGPCNVNSGFSDGTISITRGSLGVGGILWGSGSLNLGSNATYVNNSGTGTFAQSIFLSGGLFFNQHAPTGVGSRFIPTTDTWHSQIPLTIANLDLWAGLECEEADARFISSTNHPIPTVPPSWTQTNWYWDPANLSTTASDSNSGADSSHALLTWAGFISKMGTNSPILPYGQSIIVNQMSSQSAGVDSVFFEPKLSGGGQFVLNATSGWVAAGINFSAGTLGGGFGYSGAVPTAGGTPMTMASVPGYVVAGVLLFNSTRSSYAFVDSVTGGTAKLSQPQTSASLITTTAIPSGVVDNNWQAGDTIQVWTLPNLNAKHIGAEGGDLTSGGQPCASWIIGAAISDTSGSAASEYPVQADCANTVLSLCLVNSRAHVASGQGRSSSIYLLGCSVKGSVAIFSGTCTTYGGILSGGIVLDGGLIGLANNAIIHATVTMDPGSTVSLSASGAWSDAAWTNTGGFILIGGTFWGSYSFAAKASSTVFNGSASSFASTALLTTGAITINGITTGTAYAQNGIFYGPFALTPANLDTYGGLQDPVTGARIVGVVGSLPLIPVSWTQTDWYLDGSAGNDNNPGTIGSPIKTIMGGIVPKWGTASPRLSQTTTIHVVNSQSIGLERAVITPIISGTATNFVIVGTPTFGSTFSAGTTTALSAGNPGNDWTIASMPGGTAAGQLVFNVTRSSYAIIDSMSGSTATICQPFSSSIVNTVTAFPNPISITTWTTGDTIQVGTPSLF